MASETNLTPDLAALLPERAKTFAFAARFLPPAQRDATTVLYAFCRVIDDLADEPSDLTPAAVRDRLAAWRLWISTRGAAPAPEPAALAQATLEVVRRYEVPPAYLLGLIGGVESDLGPVRVEDYASLRRYCLQVAGTVGLAMCHVLGVRHPIALAAAAELGVAMQLTNLLRDVGGDLRRDRVYLPAEDLARFGYSAERLFEAAARGGRPDDALKTLLAFEVKRARAHYARGLAGIWLLPSTVRPSILMAGRLYRAILDRIEASDYDVLRRRASTSRVRKLREAAVAVLISRLWGDGPRDEVGASRDLIPSRAIEEELAWLES
jgi:15-cis-phytoene synthase